MRIRRTPASESPAKSGTLRRVRIWETTVGFGIPSFISGNPPIDSGPMLARRRIGLAFVALILWGCSLAEKAKTDPRLHAASSVSPITDLVRRVGGDAVLVNGIVPEGVDSHTHQPVPSDARALRDADIIFLNGLNLETPLLKLAKANAKPGGRIVEIGPLVVSPDELIFDFSFPIEAGDPNPHLWTNPIYAKRFTEVIRDELARADPGNASRYEANQLKIGDQIDQLDRAVRTASASIPAEQRKLLTYHDSFPYFAREYRWTVIGAIQPSDFSEPSERDVAALIDQIKAERVTAIFGSEVFPSPVLAQIARESGAKYIDDLRDDDLPSNDASYIGLMKFDFILIVEALGGDASALRGLRA